MQDTQEFNAANDELFARLHALPQRLQSRARSQLVSRTISERTRNVSSLHDASALPDGEERLARTSAGVASNEALSLRAYLPNAKRVRLLKPGCKTNPSGETESGYLSKQR
jgi:hypothetical protein